MSQLQKNELFFCGVGDSAPMKPVHLSRKSHCTFIPLTFTHTHADVGDRKHKLMQISLLSIVQVWSRSTWPLSRIKRM